MLHKKEGFAGQVSVVIPKKILNRVESNNLINGLYITDVGYYPNARYHYRIRNKGSNEHILIYVLKGCGKVVIAKKEMFICSNQFIIIPKGVSHWYKANNHDPWTIYWVHFTGEKSGFIKSISSRVITIEPGKISRINDRIQLFNEIIENLSLGFSPDNLEYANLCLYHLLASFKYINQFRTINFAFENDIVKKATLYMKQNVEKNLKLEDIAGHFNISAPHFSRLFKQRTMHSPIDYFIQIKIQHACQLLDYSNLRVNEIGSQIGYEDPYYFSRIFKKVTGLSPSNYKKRWL